MASRQCGLEHKGYIDALHMNLIHQVAGLLPMKVMVIKPYTEGVSLERHNRYFR